MTAFAPIKLQDVIARSISLPPQDARGWHSMQCQLCADYKVRAGFKFDGDKIIYHCWNCAAAAVYTEFSGKISKKFRTVLTTYGIDDSEISTAVNSSFFSTEQQSDSHSLQSILHVDLTTPTTTLPEGAQRLEPDDEGTVALFDYLKARKVADLNYTFYFSTNPRFEKRVIIPFYRDGRLIYWQARSIDPNERKRWDNSPENRTAVLFNMDQLNSWGTAPLLVTEGVFDAMMFDGVALLGSSLNDAKTALLKSSRRPLVFIIDKDKNGRELALSALENSWQIAFAPPGCADLNHSVQRYGRAWTAWYLATNRPRTRDQALLSINLNCK